MLAVREWSVQVWDAVSGSELTGQVERWEDIVASHDADSRAEAIRTMREFKKLATRLGNGSRLGRKPFGSNEG